MLVRINHHQPLQVHRTSRVGPPAGVVRQLARYAGRPIRDLFGPGLAGCASHGFRRGLCDKRYQPD